MIDAVTAARPDAAHLIEAVAAERAPDILLHHFDDLADACAALLTSRMR
ncbi:hypothetical protein [Achromobacter deleyi]|nr:hypothetical protein [Achromobacter deleyi]QVQ28492.1 hypothetical protein HLG70_08870 [Achromobacter deleyi]UIP18600.1 hypothetical protein LYZ39_16440 [Achromobacter deleyi]